MVNNVLRKKCLQSQRPELFVVECCFLSVKFGSFVATVFGQNLRLAPLKPEKKAMWKREMECLLSVCDYIVEFTPQISQNLLSGREVEVRLQNLKFRITIWKFTGFLIVFWCASGDGKQTASRYIHQPSCIEEARYNATGKVIKI